MYSIIELTGKMKVRTLAFVLTTLMLIYLVVGYPWLYIAKSTTGTVLDVDTKRPVRGAILVARWVSYVHRPGHGSHDYIVATKEAVTDKNGHYSLPGWGPSLRLPFTELDRMDPVISVFYYGYIPKTVSNAADRNNIIRVSDWSGKSIQIKKHFGTEVEYSSILNSFSARFDFSNGSWKQYPKLTRALVDMGKILEKKGVNEALRLTIPTEELLGKTFTKTYRDSGK